MGMGRPKKINSPQKMEKLWDEYKDYCNNQSALAYDFSSKNSEFISVEMKRSITYTIEGFCVYIGLSRSKFYETYSKDNEFRDIVTRMQEECEVDARRKFELNMIPTQLAGLWMSKYGYTTKTDTNISGDLSVEQTKLDDVIKQMRGGG